MSGLLKKVGKVFKSVVKVVKKVAVPALVVGAVLVTGGAALGALPALGGAGGVLASIGIKGTLASVLSGAVSTAAIGAVTSAGMAAISGGNIGKAFVKGGIMGGLTGGALGAAGLIGSSGAFGLLGSKAAAGTAAATAGLGAVPSGILATNPALLPTAVPSGALGAISNAPNLASLVATPGIGAGVPALGGVSAGLAPLVQAGAGAVTKTGGGLLGTLVGTGGVAGPLLQAGGAFLAGKGQAAAAKAEAEDAARQRLYSTSDRDIAYGGVTSLSNLDKYGNPTRKSMQIGYQQKFDYTKLNLNPTDIVGGLASTATRPAAPRTMFQIVGGQIVEVPIMQQPAPVLRA